MTTTAPEAAVPEVVAPEAVAPEAADQPSTDQPSTDQPSADLPPAKPSDKPQEHIVRQFRHIDTTALEFRPLVKEGPLYVAGLLDPIRIQTPPMTLESDVSEDAKSAFVQCSPALTSFLLTCESRILQRALDRDPQWFEKEVDDESIRYRFKSFVRPDGILKVKVQPDVAMFSIDKELIDSIDAKAQVRGILELARVSFGRHEFGIQWKLLQVQECVVPPCLFVDIPSAEEDEEVPEDQEEIDDEFM